MTPSQHKVKPLIQYLSLTMLVFVLAACGGNPAPPEGLDLETLTRRGIPAVVSTDPAEGAQGVVTDAVIKVVFNLPMNTASVEGAFNLEPEVAGAFAWSPNAKEMTFTPSAALAKGTAYRAVISTEARRKGEGNAALQEPYTFSFTTAGTRWEARDIGQVGLAGAAGVDEEGIFTMRASGDDIWNTADAFHYVYKPLVGDGEMTLRVSSLSNTDPWAKAGLMIREGLEPGARHVSVLMTAANGVIGQGREQLDGGSYAAIPEPQLDLSWLRLVRAENTFRSYASSDGQSWSLIDEKQLELWLDETQKIVGDKPMVSTETGWHYQSSCSGQPGVSEAAGAKYSTRLYLDYFNAGVERTHLYNLQLDSSCWGLLRGDGTPYPAFYGIKNMISLLNDPGSSFSTGSLSYALSGNVTNLKHSLLEKRDGTRYLILWVNAKSYDTAQRRDIDVPEQQVSLSFDTSVGSVRAYLPTRSLEAVETYSGSDLTLSVPDEPLVLELLP